MTDPNSFLFRIASHICHQDPARCLFAGNRLLPLCSRCTGLYIGFLASFLFLWATSLRKKFLHCSKKVSLISSVLFFIFLAEGFLSFKGISNTGNKARLLLGLLGGSSLGIFSFGLINYSIRGKTYFGKATFSSRNLLFLFLAIFSLFFVKIFLNPPFLFYFWYTVSFLGLFFTYTAANLAVVSVFLAGTNRKGKSFNRKLVFYTSLLLVLEVLIIGFLRR